MKLFTKATFLRSATEESHFFSCHLPTIILVGRSNVGKSSLINHLLQNRGLAKTSSLPGKTRAVNFFNVEDRFILVDLPGFGYAKVSHTMKREWAELMERYFEVCEKNALILFLLDLRRTPSKEDRAFCDFLRAKGLKMGLILTKADKLKPQDRAAQMKIIIDALELADEIHPLLYSIQDSKSRLLLHELIYSYLEGFSHETN